MFKPIKLKTKDGVEIAGDFYPVGDKGAQAVILTHMMPSNKESWRALATKLNAIGFQCLAIDLRGHGESEGGPDGYKNFSDEDHQASINDVDTAVAFFTSAGLSPEKISLVGASIGANLSFIYQASHSEIKASVPISPGLSYHGLDTEPAAKNIGENQSVFLCAGGENDAYSSETAQKLFNLLKAKNKKIKIFQNAGHGTTIFSEEPELMNEIVSWLKEIYD